MHQAVSDDMADGQFNVNGGHALEFGLVQSQRGAIGIIQRVVVATDHVFGKPMEISTVAVEPTGDAAAEQGVIVSKLRRNMREVIWGDSLCLLGHPGLELGQKLFALIAEEP